MLRRANGERERERERRAELGKKCKKSLKTFIVKIKDCKPIKRRRRELEKTKK